MDGMTSGMGGGTGRALEQAVGLDALRHGAGCRAACRTDTSGDDKPGTTKRRRFSFDAGDRAASLPGLSRWLATMDHWAALLRWRELASTETVDI